MRYLSIIPLSLILFFASFEGFTQELRYGLTASAILSDIRGANASQGNRSFFSYGFGGYTSLVINSSMLVRAQVEYVRSGTNAYYSSSSTVSDGIRMHYINVPMEFMYRFNGDRAIPYMFTGLYAGYLYKATSRQQNVTTAYNSYDIGRLVGAGISFELPSSKQLAFEVLQSTSILSITPYASYYVTNSRYMIRMLLGGSSLLKSKD